MSRLSLSIVAVLSCFILSAQSNARLARQAQQAFQNHDWINAARLYERLLSRDSSRLDWRYSYALTLYHNYDLQEALTQFNLLILHDAQKKYPLSWFYKGELLQLTENYKEAIKNYKKFLTLKKKNIPEYYTRKAQQQITGCELALSYPKKHNTEIQHMDTIINSVMSEYAPVETDSVLYFSSLRNKIRKYDKDTFTNKIYFVRLKNQVLKLEKLDTIINSDFSHNGNYCPVPGTAYVLFSRCNNLYPGEYRCAIWIAEKSGSRWIKAEPLPSPVNLPGYSSTHPHWTRIKGKNFLFFASDRPNGQGKLDIWMSECISLSEKKFLPPRPVSNLINTPDDDITPWFDTTENKLYFSSAFHPGLGGFDIFWSAYNDSFHPPVNAGPPLNSSHNDLYFSINNTRTFAYFSSNRKGSRFESKQNCCNDIYRTPLEKKETIIQKKPIDSAVIHKEKIKLLVPLTLYFHNDEPDPRTRNITTQKSYDETYFSYLKRIPEYKEEYSSGLKKSDRELAESRIDEFFSDSVQAGYQNLIQFMELMEKILTKKRDTIFITIKGYCSPLASTEYNILLAKRRISSLKNFIAKYKNGFFLPYLEGRADNGSKIIYEDVDIGELPFSKVSDDLKDKKNSVYSPFAARERKIQILAIKFSDVNPEGTLSDE